MIICIIIYYFVTHIDKRQTRLLDFSPIARRAGGGMGEANGHFGIEFYFIKIK